MKLHTNKLSGRKYGSGRGGRSLDDDGALLRAVREVVVASAHVVVHARLELHEAAVKVRRAVVQVRVVVVVCAEPSAFRVRRNLFTCIEDDIWHTQEHGEREMEI